MSGRRGGLIAGGLVLVLLVVVAFFVMRPGEEERSGEALTQTCTDDGACGEGLRCCEARCVPAAECGPPAAPSGTTAAAEPTGSAATAPPRRERQPPPPRFDAEAAPDGTCSTSTDCESPLMECEQSAGRCVESPICVGDSDCLGARLCYHGTCVDKAEGCRQADCPSGSYCNTTFGQCEQHACKTDEDCAGARRCEERGFCVECLAKDDCPGRQVCIADHRCVEPERCAEDEDCRGLRTCDVKSGRCEDVPCSTDALEPNNKIEEATALNAQSHFEQLTSCNNNADFYKLELKPGEGALVHVLFDTAHGTMEIRIRNPEGKEVGRVTDIHFEGSLVAPFERVDEPTTLYLEVRGSGGIESINAPVAYSIRRHNVPGGFCLNDTFEPSNTLADAHRIAPNQWTAARLCKGDEDWYVIDVPERDTLNVYVESIFDPTIKDQKHYLPDVEIYEPGKPQPVLVNSDEDGPSHSKIVGYVSTKTGPYYVRVLPALIDADTRYAVRLYTEPPAP